MKKISLLVLASMFSLGVMAQTTPAATPKKADAKPQPAATATSGTAKAATKPVRKTAKNRPISHHATPVKSANSPVEPKDAMKEGSKK